MNLYVEVLFWSILMHEDIPGAFLEYQNAFNALRILPVAIRNEMIKEIVG